MQTVKALPSGDHSVLTPDGNVEEVEHRRRRRAGRTTRRPRSGAPTPSRCYQAQVVHNLEHGGIFIQYGKDVPQATIDAAEGRSTTATRTATLLAPLPSLGSKIALGVWTTNSPTSPDTGTAHLAKCTTFDEAAYAAFFKAYQFKGPERFPASTLTPGLVA